jgi:hypothetical protein
MGTILGTPTYLPQAKFWINRGYVQRFAFGFGANAIIVQLGNEFIITDGNNPIVHVYCKVKADWWVWSSNGYTLDFIVEDWWLQIDPSPTKLPLNYTLTHWWDAPTGKMGVLLYLAGSTEQYEMTLPVPPPTYWWPP